jgi:hypothetical protein
LRRKTEPLVGTNKGDETARSRAGDHAVQKALVLHAGLDAESAEWVRALTGVGQRREAALARLHDLLVRIA